MPSRNRKSTKIVTTSTRLRRNEVGKAMIELTRGFIHLLTKHVEHRQQVASRFVAVYLDIITGTIGRPDPVDSFGSDKAAVHDVLKEFLRIFKQLVSLGTHLWIIENRRESVQQFPSLEKWRPIDVRRQFIERLAGNRGRSTKAGSINLSRAPIDRFFPLSSDFDREQGFTAGLLLKLGAELVLFLSILRGKARLEIVAQQRRHYSGGSRRIQHMNNRSGIVRRDFHGGMSAAGSRSTDQQRFGVTQPLHLLSDMDHFIERGSDQSTQSNQVGVSLSSFFQDSFGRYHDAEISHLEIVTGQHATDDILADIINISFDVGDDDFDLRSSFRTSFLLFFHERHEISHRLFHHARALHHLRKKHFPRSE